MKHFLLLASVLIAMPAWARTLTPAEALQRAQGDGPAKVAAAQPKSRLVKTGYTAKQQPAYYIFDNAGDKGYMILAADDVAMPVLGYSATGTINPDDMPENLRGWLENYAAEIAWAAEREASGNYIAKDLTKETAASKRDTWAHIAPLCATKWNQSEPYDLYTPEITYRGANIKAATGCVATAMAQLMKYHNYPAKGKGSVSYTWTKYSDFSNTAEGAPSTNVAMKMDFSSVTFDWANMLNVYTDGGYNDAQADAVATLMKACGYSVEMSYGPESGASTAEVADALKTYFGYDSNTRFYTRAYYDLDAWEEMLYNNLKNVGPIQYSGRNDYGGHSFIVDGYAGNGYFHLNWGWGGMSDGDFLITALDPDAQGVGGSLAGYNSNQGAILGAQPAGASIPKIVPFQMAIYGGGMTPKIANSKLTITGPFTNNGGVGDLVRVAMQFCSYNDDALVATAVCTSISGWPASIYSGLNTISATIPSSLPAGIYKVYPVASTNGGATYQKAIAQIGYPNYVLLQKKADGTYVTVAEDPAVIEFIDVTMNTPVYYGMGFQVEAKAVNDNDTEVIQSASPAFLIQSAQGWNVIAYAQTQVVDLRAGDTMSLTFDLSVLRRASSYVAGAECYFAFVDEQNGFILSEPVAVTVQEAPTTTTLKCSASGFSVVDADNVSLDNFRVNYRVYCQEGYYADPLYVLLYNEDLSGYNIDRLMTPTCYVTASNWAEASNLKLGTPTALEVGKRYAAVLFYMKNNGIKQLSNATYFTVGSANSSLADIRAEGSDSSVKASLAGGILSVTAGSDIRSIDVYDLSGARVATSTTATADLTGASDGVYVVKVTTAAGATTLKLMK